MNKCDAGLLSIVQNAINPDEQISVFVRLNMPCGSQENNDLGFAGLQIDSGNGKKILTGRIAIKNISVLEKLPFVIQIIGSRTLSPL
ncbi:MAG: hypothetical protein Q7S12_02730 [bacterium]|nr:hypothetical protein [bacterium]